MEMIEVTKRNGEKVMMSYDKLNSWLRRRALRMAIACYYEGDNWCYVFFDGKTPVLPNREGWNLLKVVC